MSMALLRQRTIIELINLMGTYVLLSINISSNIVSTRKNIINAFMVEARVNSFTSKPTVNYGELIHSKPLIYFKGQKGYNTRALNDIMNNALVMLTSFHA